MSRYYYSHFISQSKKLSHHELGYQKADIKRNKFIRKLKYVLIFIEFHMTVFLVPEKPMKLQTESKVQFVYEIYSHHNAESYQNLKTVDHERRL